MRHYRATWDWTASPDLETLYGYNGSGQQTYEHRSNPTFVWTPANDNSLELSSWSHPAIAKVGIFNQLQNEMRTTPAGVAAVSYAHDGRGNLTADGTRTFTYDYENRLEKVSRLSDGGTIATYQYDPLGRRSVKAVAGGAATWFIHAGDTEIADVDPADGKVLRRYIPGPGVDNYAAFVDETAPGSTGNIWHQPQDATAWSYGHAAQTAAGAIDGINAFQITAQSTPNWAGLFGNATTVANGDTASFALTLKASGSLASHELALHSSINGWGANPDSSAEILSGPGSLTQAAGSLWQVSGLSTTEPTRVRISRRYGQAEYTAPYVFVRSHDLAAAAGEAVIVSNPVFTAGAGGQIKYVHHDRLGSVFALSDAQGAVPPQDRFVYDPYGNSPSASGGFPFRYTGQRYDPETGLYYYRARYYNPATGRFMQNDPIGVEGGLNLYGYVGGDPVNMRDPTGLQDLASDARREMADRGC